MITIFDLIFTIFKVIVFNCLIILFWPNFALRHPYIIAVFTIIFYFPFYYKIHLLIKAKKRHEAQMEFERVRRIKLEEQRQEAKRERERNRASSKRTPLSDEVLQRLIELKRERDRERMEDKMDY